MAKMYYNKLVRDNIPHKIQSNGDTCAARPLVDSDEFRDALMEKVVEEATELSRTTGRDAFLSEYADLMVVLDTLTKELEFSEADIRVAIEDNVATKGLYRERMFLEWSEHREQTNIDPTAETSIV